MISKREQGLLCVTRFTERHLSVKVLRELLPFVVLAVEQLMTWQSLETKKEALNIECLIKNVRFIVGLLMLESITAVLKPATESLHYFNETAAPRNEWRLLAQFLVS